MREANDRVFGVALAPRCGSGRCALRAGESADAARAMGYSVNFIRLRATNNVVLRHHHRRVRVHDPMEADTRLLVARQQAAAAADRNTALALRKALKEFVECGVALDETLVAIGEEGHAVREAASKLHHGVVKVAKAIVAGARTGAVSEFELAAAVGRQHLSDRMR